MLLDGADWTSDSSVTIVVTDTEDQSVAYEGTAVVDTDALFSDSFMLPKKPAATYDVTVTGADSGAEASVSVDASLELVTIASDLPDYAPASKVTLTGTGWVGDAKVHIVVNDSVGQSWQHDMEVSVAEDGTIVDVFNLPDYFVATYGFIHGNRPGHGSSRDRHIHRWPGKHRRA